MALLLLPALASAYMAPSCLPRSAGAAAVRSCSPVMDETIIEKALLGGLEEYAKPLCHSSPMALC